MLFEKHVLNWIQKIWQLSTWHYIFQHNTARFVLHYENVAVRLLTRLIHGFVKKKMYDPFITKIAITLFCNFLLSLALNTQGLCYNH